MKIEIPFNGIFEEVRTLENTLKITLASARVNVGLSQKEAAKEMGISNKTLCSWELGVTSPTVKQIARLCELYGVTYDNLKL